MEEHDREAPPQPPRLYFQPRGSCDQQRIRALVASLRETYRKITNGFRSQWGAKQDADIRSVIETGRRRSIGALQAIRNVLAAPAHPSPFDTG